MFLLLFLLFVSTAAAAAAAAEFEWEFEWIEVNIPGERTSMSMILDPSMSMVYLCGGQISLFSKSSSCIAIEIAKEEVNGYESYLLTERFDGERVIKSAGPFPGLYLNARSFFSEAQNEGAIYGDRMCMLSISDGTNKPKCWCCDNNANNDDIKCDDLQYTINGGCPERFEACVVHSRAQNTIYQIGGYYGQHIYSSILCFDVERETYLMDDECSYGELLQPMYGMGCAVLPDEHSSIITVGGSDTLSRSSSASFSSSLTICDNSECKSSSLSLDDGVLSTRVFAIDECHIGIVGGIIQSEDGSEISSDEMSIANVCTSQWLHRTSIPLPLSEMALIKMNAILCLYGGKSVYYNAITPQYSDHAYCIDLGTTLEPTRQPTAVPTDEPSLVPTVSPTKNMVSSAAGTIELSDPQFTAEFATFTRGISGQTCFANDDALYVCGGYSDEFTSYNECFVYDADGHQTVLSIYVAHHSNHSDLVQMASFYCKHDCFAMYNDALFLVNPRIEGESQSSIHFFKCSLVNEILICMDLCDNIKFCDDLIKFESCITASGQYLYITGGYDVSGEISDDIAVFDMDPLQLAWISVPDDSFPALLGYHSYFGSLSMPVAAHSCAVWNSSLYIIGGKDASGVSLSSIQICARDNINGCALSEITLNDARYNARSIVVGSSIVTVCGAATVEVYDALQDKASSSSILASGQRTACCVIDWSSKAQIVISGGETETAETIDNMVTSAYTVNAIAIDDDNDSDASALLQCKHINVDTRDFSFKSIYSIYNEINDYYIFATDDKKAYLIIDASGAQKTWIYNYTEKTSCYYNSYNGEREIVTLGPGLWTKPRTRYSQTHSILITITCNDALYGSQSTHNGNNNAFVLWGITEASFITIVVVSALIIITLLLVGFCCWLKTKTNTNKINRKQHTQLSTHNDDDDDDEDDYKTIKIVRHHSMESDDGRVRDSLSDGNKSNSTVNPHEVTFEAHDQNTLMLDKVALEIKRKQMHATLNNTEQSSLTIHRNMLKPQQAPLLHLPHAVQDTIFADDI